MIKREWDDDDDDRSNKWITRESHFLHSKNFLSYQIGRERERERERGIIYLTILYFPFKAKSPRVLLHASCCGVVGRAVASDTRNP